MNRRDEDRLNEALRLDERGTKRRWAGYTRQRHHGFGRTLPPTARQLRRIVAKARGYAYGGGR